MLFGSLGRGVVHSGPLVGSGPLPEHGSPCVGISLLEKVAIRPNKDYSTSMESTRLQDSAASGQTAGREPASLISRKRIKDLLITALSTRARTQFSPQTSPSHKEVIQPPHPHPSEGRQYGKHNHRKLTKLYYIDHSFV